MMMRRVVSFAASKVVARRALGKGEIRFVHQRKPDAEKAKDVPKSTFGVIVKEQFMVFLADHLLGKVYSAVASAIVIVGTGGLVYYLFSSQLRSIGSAVADTYRTATGGITEKTEAAKERIRDIKERAKASLDAGREKASASIGGARDALKSGAGAGIDYVHDTVKNSAESVRSTAGAVKEKVTDSAGALGGKVVDMKDRVGASIGSTLSSIGSSLPRVPGIQSSAPASSGAQSEAPQSVNIDSKVKVPKQDTEQSLSSISTPPAGISGAEVSSSEKGKLAQAAQGLLGRLGVRKGGGSSAEDRGKDA
jgi:vacuolar-type H+-ATPase subunit H